MKMIQRLIVFCAFTSQLHAQVSFTNSSSPGVGTQPIWVAAADLNGDGKLELISANSGGNTLSILTNNGSGGFVLASTPIVGNYAVAVAAADVNGDGKLDLICDNDNDNTLSILTNNGSGSFVLASTPGVGNNPYSVIAADLNGDGKVDLICANYGRGGGNTLSVLTNNGSGGFTLAASPGVGNGPIAVIAADLNGDGKLDLISANIGSSTLSILTNNGSGGFVLASSPKVGSNPYAVTAADVNGDGKLDLISANRGSSTLSILTNNGSGGFVLAASPGVGSAPQGVTAADVNGDGKVDLISANSVGNSLTILTNNGSGGFVVAASPTVGNYSVSVLAADLNGDGKLDLVSANYNNNSLSVLLNTTPFSSCVAPPAGLVSWWRAQGNAVDVISGNNGSAVGNLGYTNGEVGQAFVFDGSTSYISVPATPSLNIGATGSGLTIECWIEPIFSGSAMPIVEWNSGATGLQLWEEASRQLFANLSDTSGNNHVFTSTNGLINSTNFQHVALTYDKSSGMAVLYYNGGVVATNNFGSITPQTTYPVNIGLRPGVAIYKGLLDELSLYNRALSAAEIQAIYAAGGEGKCFTPGAPTITTQPTNQTVSVGGTATFNVVAAGSSPLNYQWSLNTTNLVGATNATLTLTNVQSNQAGNYSVLVSSAYGSILSSNAALAVVGNPVPTGIPIITSFNPISNAPGNYINIWGTNFSSSASANTVYFGAVRATVAAASPTNLLVVVPTGATYAPITETVYGWTAYSPAPFIPTFPSGNALSSSALAPRLDLAAGTGPARVVFGDLDGDGKPDMVVANAYVGSIWVYRNISTNGSLTAASFAPPVIFTIGGGTDSQYGLALADVDGDGRLDIVTANRNLSIVSIFQNLSSPGSLTTNSFAARLDIAIGGSPTAIAIGDLNGDGKSEIVTANYAGNNVTVLQNISNGGMLTTNSFASPVNLATGSSPSQIAIADMDGDGKPDLVTVNVSDMTRKISILRNIITPGTISTNSFASAVNLSGADTGETLAVGDLDGDGKPDIIAGSYTGSSVSVYRNISSAGSITTNSFSAPVVFAAGGHVHAVALGDLDGDGKPDLALVTQSSDKFSVFRNISSPGSFMTNSLGTRIDFSSGNNPDGIGIGDLDGDGRPDIAFGNVYGGKVSVYRNIIPFGNPPVCVPPPAGLVSWWPAEGNANDIVSGNNGTLQGGITYAAGEVGQAFSFNNTNAAVFVPASASLNVGTGSGFTLEAWIQPAEVTNITPIFEWNVGDGTTAWGVHFWICPGQPFSASPGPGELYADIVDTGGGNHQLSSNGGATAPGVLQHVALTYDKTTGLGTIYCNGVIVAQHNMGSFTPQTSYNLYLGRRPGPDMIVSYAGLLDEPSIYNRALSLAEIAAIYHAGSAGKCELTPPPPPPARDGKATAVEINGFVIGVNLTDGGSGYTGVPLVRFIGGGGSGAQGFAVVSNGVVTGITVTDAGSGYTSAPVVVIEPPYISQPVLDIAPMSFLSFSNLTVGGTYQLQRSQAWYWTNQPVNFTATNTLFTQMVAGVFGSGNFRLALNPVPTQAFATPIAYFGFIVGANVTSGGSGYVTSPAVSIVGGGGTNAMAMAQISGGVVTNILITDAGIGYTNTPTIKIAQPPAAAVTPTVLPVMRVDAAQLAPYDNYQVQFTPDLTAAWANWNGGLFSPTATTNSQYLFITNDVGFFRLLYVP